jgi:hypothetical protein
MQNILTVTPQVIEPNLAPCQASSVLTQQVNFDVIHSIYKTRVNESNPSSVYAPVLPVSTFVIQPATVGPTYSTMTAMSTYSLSTQSYGQPNTSNVSLPISEVNKPPISRQNGMFVIQPEPTYTVVNSSLAQGNILSNTLTQSSSQSAVTTAYSFENTIPDPVVTISLAKLHKESESNYPITTSTDSALVLHMDNSNDQTSTAIVKTKQEKPDKFDRTKVSCPMFLSF